MLLYTILYIVALTIVYKAYLIKISIIYAMPCLALPTLITASISH